MPITPSKELMEAMIQEVQVQVQTQPLPQHTMNILNSKIISGNVLSLDYSVSLDDQPIESITYVLTIGCTGNVPDISYADLLARLLARYTLTRLDGGQT